jgi:hypothetical protein
MTTDAEIVVRRAYHVAEGNVMDLQALSQLISHVKPPESGKNTHA